jgi:hypothetical protein
MMWSLWLALLIAVSVVLNVLTRAVVVAVAIGHRHKHRRHDAMVVLLTLLGER